MRLLAKALSMTVLQLRGRGLSDGTTADTVVRGILDIPENLCALCIIAVGHKADERKPQNEDRLKWENVHVGKFNTQQ